MRAIRSGLVAAALLGALIVAPVPAHAQDLAAAEALFEEGKSLSAEGRFAEACPKFGASYAADPSVGTLLNWADCLEKEGKLGSALRRFREAEGKLAAAEDARAKVAAERAAALEGRAPRLSITSSSPAPAGIGVFVGGEAIAMGALATGAVEVLVDPGAITVEIRREDRVLERRDGEGKEGVLGELALDLAAIDRAHPDAAPAPPPAPPREEPSAVPRVLGWVLVATGGAAILVAGTLEVVAIGENSSSEEVGHCRDGLCSPEGYDEVQTAGDLAEAGQWVGLAGIGMLAVGITLVLTAPDGEPAAPPTKTAVRLRAGPGRLSLGGQF